MQPMTHDATDAKIANDDHIHKSQPRFPEDNGGMLLQFSMIVEKIKHPMTTSATLPTTTGTMVVQDASPSGV